MPRILALDQASNCGWCCGDDSHGVWDLRTLRDESSGMKWIRFKTKLKEIISAENIELIVYERVAGQHASSLIHAAKMVAIVETLCEELGIEYAAFSAKEIKSWATGKGNASKELMIKAAHDNYGYKGSDDNEADAILIYQMAKAYYK